MPPKAAATKTVREAMKDALEFLEHLGYKKGGDIHDNLEEAMKVVSRYTIANRGIPQRIDD